MRGFRGELKEVVGFTAHDDEVLFLGRGELGAVCEGIEKTVKAGVIALCCCVAGSGDDADLDVLAEEI